MIDEVNNSDKKKDMIVCEEIIQVPSLIEERLIDLHLKIYGIFRTTVI